MASFKYQVYLHGSEAIIYLNAILGPSQQAALPPSVVYGSKPFTFSYFEEKYTTTSLCDSLSLALKCWPSFRRQKEKKILFEKI